MGLTQEDSGRVAFRALRENQVNAGMTEVPHDNWGELRADYTTMRTPYARRVQNPIRGYCMCLWTKSIPTWLWAGVRVQLVGGFRSLAWCSSVQSSVLA
jgi:hypothetical protein